MRQPLSDRGRLLGGVGPVKYLLVSALAVVSLVFGTVAASPASAAVSRFEGLVESPARGEAIAVVQGDFTVDPNDCPDRIGSLDKPKLVKRPYYLGLFGGDGKFIRGVASLDDAGTIYVDERLSLDPGVYTLQLATWYELTGSWDTGEIKACVPLTPKTISVVKQTALTGQTVTSSSKLYAGEKFRLSLEHVISWSDGVTTTQPAPALRYHYKLQDRPLGTSAWATTDMDGPSIEVVADTPREFRILDGQQVSKPVTVDVIRPTSAREIADVTLSPTAAIAGATLTLTGVLRSQYTDQTWRPSPAGTTYEVQFLPQSADSWLRLYESTIEEPGEISIQFPMTGTGRYRLASSDGVSASVEVVAIIPTSVVAVEPLTLPTTVAAGAPVNISSTATVEYSDGIYRPVVPGTTFVVEFQPATTQRAKKPKWQVVRTAAVVKPGQLVVRVKAKQSGFWRMKVGTVATTPVFMRVR